MHKIAFIALVCLGAAACSPTANTVGGAAVGATAGAVVAGPVGAVVGGTVGAAAGATTGSQPRPVAMASPGRCYVYDEAGRQAIDRRGRPITTRC